MDIKRVMNYMLKQQVAQQAMITSLSRKLDLIAEALGVNPSSLEIYNQKLDELTKGLTELLSSQIDKRFFADDDLSDTGTEDLLKGV